MITSVSQWFPVALKVTPHLLNHHDREVICGVVLPVVLNGFQWFNDFQLLSVIFLVVITDF